MMQMAEREQIDKEVVNVLVENFEEIANNVAEECEELLHNYIYLKERYRDIQNMQNKL